MNRFAKVLTIAASVLLSYASSAYASQQENPGLENFRSYGFNSKAEMKNYFEVSKFEVTESATRLEENTRAALFTARVAPLSDDNSEVLDNIGAVVTNPYDVNAWTILGRRVWKIVVDNQPVVNVSTQRVSVLPKGQTNWTRMENWRGPVAKSYTLEAKNLYGVTVIKHVYTVAYNYGGSVQGKGKYLANATIIPTEVDVSWGFELGSDVEVGQVLNTGTNDNPIPGVDLQLKWKMKSVLKKIEGRDSFFVRGDGRLSHITGGL